MAKCCIYPGICSGNWSKQQECPASETGGFSDTDITYLWQVSHHITCDCWNVWHLWLSHLKYKVHFLKPPVSMVQKWLTTLKPKYQSYVLVLYAFRSRFGAEALQSNGLTLKRGEWWICVNLAFPLQAPGWPCSFYFSECLRWKSCKLEASSKTQGFSSPSALPLS